MTDMWDKDAKKRAESHRKIILAKLREAGEKGLTNIKLKEVTFRFGQAIHTLYMQGYVIKTDDLSKGVCRYTLIKEPEVELSISKEKAIDILAQEIDDQFENGVSGTKLIEIIDTLGFDVKRKKNYYRPKTS